MRWALTSLPTQPTQWFHEPSPQPVQESRTTPWHQECSYSVLEQSHRKKGLLFCWEGPQLHTNFPTLPTRLKHLPWKGFSTLDFHGSTRASWQVTTSRKHFRYPYFPSLCSRQHFSVKSQKRLTIPFKKWSSCTHRGRLQKKDREYTDGKQNTEFPLWKLILRVTKHIIPGNCFYLAITLTLQEGNWHWKQTVLFKNQGRELTGIPGHSHLNTLHYLQCLRILNQRLRVLFAE